MRVSVVLSATVAVLVGFGGTIAVVVAATDAVGADRHQASSWVFALALSMAATSAVLSALHRIPVITAWSTPGAALIAGSATGIGMNAAAGAFVLVGALVLASALVRPLGRLVERLPIAVASAMLAGILFRFVVGVFESAAAEPALVMPLILLFVVVRPFSPAAAVLAVLVGGAGLAAVLGEARAPATGFDLSGLILVAPTFDVSVLIGLGVPLFLVTMAGQNVPGFAVLRAAGYAVPARSILTATGLASIISAAFGAHTTNLAAITAAICTGPDTHPDPARRWWSGVAYGFVWLGVGLFGATFLGLLAALPAALIATVAGLALVGPLVGALGAALGPEADRTAAVMTLALTASGISILGVGSAFWGLVGGLFVLALDRVARPPRGRV